MVPDLPENLKYTFSLHIKDLAATSINENSDENISIYPNPTDDIININFEYSLNESTILSVYDINGKEVLNLSLKNLDIGNNIISINMSNLSSGIYNIRIKSDKNTITKSFIKN